MKKDENSNKHKMKIVSTIEISIFMFLWNIDADQVNSITDETYILFIQTHDKQ